MYTVKLPLKTTYGTEQHIEKCFFALFKVHNVVTKHGKKLLRIIARDKDYRMHLSSYTAAKEEIRGLKDSGGPETSDRFLSLCEEAGAHSKAMNDLRRKTGLTKTGLESYVKKVQHTYRNHVSSHIAQKEVERILSGIEAVLFGNGKDIHFKKYEDFHTIATKSTTNGICFYDLDHGIDHTPKRYHPCYRTGVRFMGVDIPVKKPAKPDDYMKEALSHLDKLSYCMISREMFSSGWRYYVILVIDDEAPKKFAMGNGKTGIDPGTSTISAVSDDFVLLEELAPDCTSYNRKIARLQAKIDRSKRASNPDNYNPDGTCKKGRHDWVFSNTCKADRRKLKTLFRKKAAYTECEHNSRANRILTHSDTVICEKMSFSSLAKRSGKKTERSDKVSVIKKKNGTGRKVFKFKKKKRFGKSVTDRAPGGQVAAVKRKMLQYGGTFEEIPAKTIRASQYDHVKDTCIKVPLSCRFKDVGGLCVQRDLYSAFLISKAKPDLSGVDRNACIKAFPDYIKLQDELITIMKADGKSRPFCFGF